MNFDLTEDEANTIVYVLVRYSLGRKTYIVGESCELVGKLLPCMKYEQRALYASAIAEAIQDGKAGDPCDVAEWEKLLEAM